MIPIHGSMWRRNRANFFDEPMPWKGMLVALAAVVGLGFLVVNWDTCNCKDSVIVRYSAHGQRSGGVQYRVWLRGVEYDGGAPCVRGTSTSEYYFIHQAEYIGDSVHLKEDPWP